jgi:hypothetical protein
MFGSYLNNAIHCEAWCQCLKTLLARDQVTPIELLRALKSLHDQLAYLEIVTNGHAGNWPTIGCCGMRASVSAFRAGTQRMSQHGLVFMVAAGDNSEWRH